MHNIVNVIKATELNIHKGLKWQIFLCKYFNTIRKKIKKRREGGRACSSWMSKQFKTTRLVNLPPEQEKEHHRAGNRGIAGLGGADGPLGFFFPEACRR